MKKLFVILLVGILLSLSLSSFCTENPEVKKYIRELEFESSSGLSPKAWDFERLRKKATEVLTKMGKATVSGLIKALKHKHWPIRWCAAAALGDIGDSSAIPVLKKALKKEKDERAQAAIERAIEKLSQKQKK